MSMLVSYVPDLSKLLSPKIHETVHLKGGLLLFLLIIGFLFATGEEGVVIVPGLLNRRRETSSASPSRQIPPLTPRIRGSQLLLLLSFLLRLTCCCCSSVGTWNSLRGVDGFDLCSCCTREKVDEVLYKNPPLGCSSRAPIPVCRQRLGLGCVCDRKNRKDRN